MRHAILIAALAACAVPMAAHAQTGAAPASATVDPNIDPFFEALKRGPATPALALLTRNSPRLTARVAETEELPKQIDAALQAYGPVLSWERIESAPLGTLLRRDTWLVQHRDFTTRWRFVYMRTGAGWTLTSFVFDDQAPSWFE